VEIEVLVDDEPAVVDAAGGRREDAGEMKANASDSELNFLNLALRIRFVYLA
jgi:hypothetical protein